MTIMFVTTVLPADRRTGSEIASSSFVEAMRASGHRVVVLGYRRPRADASRGRDEISAGARPIESREGGLRVGPWVASALVRRLPYSVAKYRSPRYAAALRRARADASPDLVVVDHAQMGWTLPLEGTAVPTVLLAHNVEHELYGQAARRGGPIAWANRREARLMKAFELRAFGAVDRVWALTEADAAALGSLGGRPARAFPLPPTVDVADPPATYVRDVAILGTWTWDANAAGLRWFIDEVRPLLDGSVKIAVAGAGSERFAAEPNVEAIGRVEDAGAFLASSRSVAVPSVAGGGLQIKTLDAIASGSPVVATPTALRGIDDPPRTVRVAEDPEAFAAAIRAVLDPAADAGGRAVAADWVRRRRALFASALDDELARAAVA